MSKVYQTDCDKMAGKNNVAAKDKDAAEDKDVLHSLLKKRKPTIRPAFSPWPEIMCFQADPSSGLVLYTVKELRDAGRLKLRSVQKAYIIGMEGNKGKQAFGSSASTAGAAFSRTATHVFRMVMLEACGVDPDNWPTGGESSHRNEDKMKYEQVLGDKLVLADSYEEAREYWCEFDKMYPHYVMEKFLEEKTGTLNNVMIIFKNYMQEMIEISMNVCAQHNTGNKINCCVSAHVVHRSIELEGAGGMWLDRLALAVRGSRQPLLQHFDMLMDLVPSDHSPADLDAHLSVMYDSLPTTVTEIDDTLENENTKANPPAATSGKDSTPVSTKGAREETTTTKIETKIRQTDPRTNEVVETKRVVTEKTVTSTKTPKASRSKKRVAAPKPEKSPEDPAPEDPASEDPASEVPAPEDPAPEKEDGGDDSDE